MSQAPDAEQQRGHLKKLRASLEGRDAPKALALLRLVRMSGLNDPESAQIIRALSDRPSPDDFSVALRWCDQHLDRLAPSREDSLFDDLDLLGDLDDLVSLDEFDDLETVGDAEMIQIEDIEDVGEDEFGSFFDLESEADDGGFFEHLNVEDSEGDASWRFDDADIDESLEALSSEPEFSHPPADAGGVFGEHTRRIDPTAALAQLGIGGDDDAGASLRKDFSEHTRQFDPAQLRALHTSPEASAPQIDEPEERSFAGPNEPTGVSRALPSPSEPADSGPVAPSIESFFDDFDDFDAPQVPPSDAGQDADSEGYDFALGASLSVPFEESGEFEPHDEPEEKAENVVDRTEIVSAPDYDFAMGASISTPIEELLDESSHPEITGQGRQTPPEPSQIERFESDLKFSFDEPSSADDFDLDFNFDAPPAPKPAAAEDDLDLDLDFGFESPSADEPETSKSEVDLDLGLDFNFDAPAPSPSEDNRRDVTPPPSTGPRLGQRPQTGPRPKPPAAASQDDDLDFDFNLGPDSTPAPPQATPFTVPDSVPGEVVPPEDDFFFPAPLNAQAEAAGDAAPLTQPEDDFFFPPPLNAATDASGTPDPIQTPQEDDFFPAPLNAQANPASTAQGADQPDEDDFFPAPLSAAPSSPRAEEPTARTPAPPPKPPAVQDRPTGKMPSLERTRQRQDTPMAPHPRQRQDTPMAPQPNVAALQKQAEEAKLAEQTPPRGTTPLPFAADAPSSGVISTKRDHVDEEEFFALADSLASESSMSSLFELSDHHRAGPHYRGEPVVREVGNEPTPAHVEPVQENAEPTNPFAHEAPTGVRNRPLSEMAASSFVLEEVDGPPSEISDEGANFDAITAQARRLYEQGDFETAHEIISDVLNQTDHTEARQLRSVLEGEMERIQQDRLGSLVQVPTLKVSMGKIASLDLDNRAGFLLSQIDGMLCFEDILDMSSMSRLETLTVLADLFESDIIGVE